MKASEMIYELAAILNEVGDVEITATIDGQGMDWDAEICEIGSNKSFGWALVKLDDMNIYNQESFCKFVEEWKLEKYGRI